MKINILPPSVYNQIAAGEVVENPASIAKELIENSLDAASKSINIYIEDGGIKSISVIDDGIGIPSSEIPKTILSHATSKIFETTDLYSISTLGFRGEALASIASVSEFEIISRYYKEQVGRKLYMKGNDVNIENIARNIGTTVTIKNLFFNTPARFKFLKSAKSEENQITKLIKKFILANPNVSFKYFIDGSLKMTSDGLGLESALKSLYEKEIFNNLIFTETDIKGIKIAAYISNYKVTKNNRNEQLIIINGRIIENQQITSTIQNAYGDRLMKKRFPIFVLNIVMPFEDIDINVHPNKKEVRISTNTILFGVIYKSIKSAIEKDEEKKQEELFKKEILFKDQFKDHIDSNNIEYLPDSNDLLEQQFEEIRYVEKLYNFEEREETQNLIEDASPFENSLEKEPFQEKFVPTSKGYEVIGQIFGTYILVLYQDSLYLIDQHATHERILYDEIINRFNESEIIMQNFLVPIIVDFDNDTLELLLKNKEAINDIGVDFEHFGDNSIKINGVSLSYVEKINYFTFLSKIAEYLKYNEKKHIGALLKEQVASTACKAAIKGNTYFSSIECEKIFEYFIENNFPVQCPHGRPTFIKFSKKEIEKMFKRI